MLEQTPYNITFEGLFITVNIVSIELLYYIAPISTFKDKEDVFAHAHVKAKYTDTDFQRSMDMTLSIVINSPRPLDQRLVFTGKFSVSDHKKITLSYVAVRLAQYAFNVMDKYISEKPLVDKNGKLFALPHFPFGESHFDKVPMG